MGEIENTAMKPFQIEVVFYYLQYFVIRNSWEFKQFCFSLVSFYYIQAIKTIMIVLNIALGHRSNIVSLVGA